MEAQRASTRFRRRGQRAGEFEIAHRGVEVVRDRLVDLARQERGEHDDRQPAARLAKLDALVERRDAEVRHALALRGLRHLDRAVAVGVGLQDQQDLGLVRGPAGVRRRFRTLARQQLAHSSQVRCEAIEIHLDPGGDGHRHGVPPRCAGVSTPRAPRRA